MSDTEIGDEESGGLTEELANSTEFADEEYGSPEEDAVADFSQAVLWATDWTTETLISQLERGNIELNPRFQRRDAWNRGNKSKFIESLILGLPIPQIVLAERKDARGRYIVLDGKQRLLSLYNFAGFGEGKDVGFRLSSLDIRDDLKRKKYQDLETDPALRSDYDALTSHTIRAVVIRNWPNLAFLHLVFLRLNTGSLKLSPQELRQAAVPGPFADFSDDFAIASEPLQRLLGRTTPDPRMRDVELLVRHLALRLRLPSYRGRMKEFLDHTCAVFNENWDESGPIIAQAAADFIDGVVSLEGIFGEQGIARKAESRLFNRSIFDALSFYAANADVRTLMEANAGAVREAYAGVLANEEFQAAVESDTAGIPHTVARISLWGAALAQCLNINLQTPTVGPENQIMMA